MEEGGEYYVVRKGNTIAIYDNLSDCQAQVCSSVFGPAVSVYKGFSWSKGTEEHLISRGLKKPLFTIDASEMNDDMFGTLVPCSHQDVGGSSANHITDLKKKGRERDVTEIFGAKANLQNIQNKKHCNLENYQNDQPKFPNQVSSSRNPNQSLEAPRATIANNDLLCILEFDGASKGNPGKAGAGALLRTECGKPICKIREGLGLVTNNIAEYKAVILGLKYALNKGFKRIEVSGDSNLVVMQVQGLWQVKHANMIPLHKQVCELKSKFQYFKIQHVRREFNSDADHQANLGAALGEGQITKDEYDF